MPNSVNTLPQIYSGLPTFSGGSPATTMATEGGGSSNSTLGDIGSIINLLAGGYGLYNASQLNSKANTVYQQSDPFGAYRPQYGADLLSLIQNPSSVTSLPGYSFLMDQGTQALERGAAAPGGVGLGSGGEGQALEQYGQGLATSFYNDQVGLLAHLAGADISPANPYQALAGLGGAAGSVGNSIAGLSSGLSGVAGLLSKLFPGTSDTSGAYNLTSQDFNSIDPGNNSGMNLSTINDPSDPLSFNINPDDPSLNLDPGTIDLSGLFGNPSAAGGEAANMDLSGSLTDISNNAQMPTDINYGSGGSSGGLNLGSLGTAYGAATGFASGTPTGDAAGAIDLAKLYGSYSGDTAVSSIAGPAGGILGLYSGLERGGAAGDIQAGTSAVSLANTGASAAGLESAGTAASVGSTIGAVAPIVGLGIYAASTPAYTLGKPYYDRVNQTFNNLVSAGISDPDFMSNYDELINAQNSGDVGENTHNAAALSPQQMSVLNSMYDQYISTYMPWIGQSTGPAGPSVRVGGGRGTASQK